MRRYTAQARSAPIVAANLVLTVPGCGALRKIKTRSYSAIGLRSYLWKMTGLRPHVAPHVVPHTQRRPFRADFLEDANTEVPKRREAIASICSASAVS
jgi:hypothetical protein